MGTETLSSEEEQGGSCTLSRSANPAQGLTSLPESTNLALCCGLGNGFRKRPGHFPIALSEPHSFLHLLLVRSPGSIRECVTLS